MLKTCEIQIKVKEDNGKIKISVSDNGPGMTGEELEKVRNFQIESKGHGIGLKNIYERLKMAFGDEMNFEISSRFGEGTRITIQIPIRKKGSENV